jgi:hypothetical protein
MSSLTAFSLKEKDKTKKHPLAICSGELIHILYPNGDLELTTIGEIEHHPLRTALKECLVWGYLEDV